MYKKVKRIVIEVSEELHYELKMQALQEKTTIKTLMLETIENRRKELVK